jgi:hypothetical protein
MRLFLSVGLCVILFFGFACGNSPSDQRSANLKSENLSVDQVPHDRPGDRSVRESERFVPGQVLVAFKKGTKRQIIDEIQQELGLETVRIVSRPDLYLMKIKSNVSVPDMIRLLQNSGAVEYAEPNFRRTIQ